MSHQQRHLEPVRPNYGWKNIVAGAAGGVVASWTMERFMVLTRRLTEDQSWATTEQGRSARNIRWRQRRGKPEGPPVKTASILSERVFHHKLTPSQRRLAGPAMHYGLGMVTGASYGAMAEITPLSTRGLGVPYGAAVWLAADEIGMPAAGLSPPPTRQPLIAHVRALAAHLVYGLTTELSRRGLLRLIGRSDRRRAAQHEFHTVHETGRPLAS